MGFYPPATDVILQEHLFRPITGRALMIGRQLTQLTPDDVGALLRRYGIQQREVAFEIDTVNTHVGNSKVGPFVMDRSFFAAFSECLVEALDITDYEGAEVIHDMSTPVPPRLYEQYDFIFDGSSIDNIFDVATAIRNLHLMLKPGGRMVLINYSNSHPTAYTKLSPDWYMDWFSFQEYADARVLVAEELEDRRKWRIWTFDPYVVYSGQNGYQWSQINSQTMQATICMGEKGGGPTKPGSPVQMHYRVEKEPYLSSAIRFHNSPRRYDFSHIGPITSRPSISGYDVLALLGDGELPRRQIWSSLVSQIRLSGNRTG